MRRYALAAAQAGVPGKFDLASKIYLQSKMYFTLMEAFIYIRYVYCLYKDKLVVEKPRHISDLSPCTDR